MDRGAFFCLCNTNHADAIHHHHSPAEYHEGSIHCP